MRKFCQVLFAMLHILLCAVSAVAIADEQIIRSYTLPDRSSIQLKAPVSWKYELQLPPSHPTPTIVFKPKSKRAFEILITPLGPVAKAEDLPSFEQIRQIVQKGAEHAQSRATEKEIQIKELKGAVNRGYYFFATDREPEQEGYRYMTQGTIRVGTLILMFTILTNDGQESVTTDALSMLKNSLHVYANAT